MALSLVGPQRLQPALLLLWPLCLARLLWLALGLQGHPWLRQVLLLPWPVHLAQRRWLALHALPPLPMPLLRPCRKSSLRP
jgi:hypothetical protein